MISGINLDSKLFVLAMEKRSVKQIKDFHSTIIRPEPAMINRSRIAIGTLFEMYRTNHIQEEGELMYICTVFLIKKKESINFLLLEALKRSLNNFQILPMENQTRN